MLYRTSLVLTGPYFTSPYWSILDITGPYNALLGGFLKGAFLVQGLIGPYKEGPLKVLQGITKPYRRVLRSLTVLYRALLNLTRPYRTLLCLIGRFIAFAD